MGVIFMDETRLERGLAATIPADVADYDRHTDAGSTQQWARSIGLAAAVGIAYFLAARLSLLLLTKPDGVGRVLAGFRRCYRCPHCAWTACALAGRRWRDGRDDCCQFHG
jgi:hypothetical protein